MGASEVYAGLKPAEVWRHFGALNGIPRPSGEEAAACEYVKKVAADSGAQAAQDSYGNVVVRIAATPGREDAPVTAVQSHLDMVCQKLPGIPHNFSTDPIRPQIEGDIVRASGTTLGADNGIGAALALALLTSHAFEHGPLELIFTVEEETGLFGAASLDMASLNCQYLINLDSEDPEELTVGCAGGAGVTIQLPVNREAVPETWAGYEIKVSGLKGGHSGVQIHEKLANAIKLLAEVLSEISQAEINFRLASIQGGSAHNAIPRDCLASIAVDSSQSEALQAFVTAANNRLRMEWAGNEDGLRIEATAKERVAESVLDEASTLTAVKLFNTLPHGIVAMSEVFEGKVETSCNLAIVITNQATIDLHVSSRSFIPGALEQQQQHVITIAEGLGATTEVREGYPGWEPNAGSLLLKKAEAAYEQVYGHPASVQVVHAGLECGIIVDKKPELEAISFGPLIRFAHSPDECVYASTVENSWLLLQRLLTDIATT